MDSSSDHSRSKYMEYVALYLVSSDDYLLYPISTSAKFDVLESGQPFYEFEKGWPDSGTSTFQNQAQWEIKSGR